MHPARAWNKGGGEGSESCGSFIALEIAGDGVGFAPREQSQENFPYRLQLVSSKMVSHPTISVGIFLNVL